MNNTWLITHIKDVSQFHHKFWQSWLPWMLKNWYLPLWLGTSNPYMFLYTVPTMFPLLYAGLCQRPLTCTWGPARCCGPRPQLLLCSEPVLELLLLVPLCCLSDQCFLATDRTSATSSICWWYMPSRSLTCHDRSSYSLAFSCLRHSLSITGSHLPDVFLDLCCFILDPGSEAQELQASLPVLSIQSHGFLG